MSITSKVWEYGTEMPAVIIHIEGTLVALKGANGEGFILVGTSQHDVEPVLGAHVMMRFERGGPTGGHWRIVREDIPLPALFDRWEPDPAALVLGTGFMRFTSPYGVDGLAKGNAETLEILALHALDPGTGQLRRFMSAAKVHVRTIIVWEVWNPMLAAVLKRWGFVPTQKTFPAEVTNGFVWRRGVP